MKIKDFHLKLWVSTFFLIIKIDEKMLFNEFEKKNREKLKDKLIIQEVHFSHWSRWPIDHSNKGISGGSLQIIIRFLQLQNISIYAYLPPHSHTCINDFWHSFIVHLSYTQITPLEVCAYFFAGIQLFKRNPFISHLLYPYLT